MIWGVQKSSSQSAFSYLNMFVFMLCMMVGCWSTVGSQQTSAISDFQSVKLKDVPCSTEDHCEDVEGTFCNKRTKLCECKHNYPVTDSKHCYKESKYGEFCRLDVQCQRLDGSSRCNGDLNVCQCQPRFKPTPNAKGRRTLCVAEESRGPIDTSAGSYWDPALFGIMGGLFLMFIVMCVVLQLFARAQFQENRSIFNTPNPRLMNVSLIKDNTNSVPVNQKRKPSGQLDLEGFNDNPAGGSSGGTGVISGESAKSTSGPKAGSDKGKRRETMKQRNAEMRRQRSPNTVSGQQGTGNANTNGGAGGSNKGLKRTASNRRRQQQLEDSIETLEGANGDNSSTPLTAKDSTRKSSTEGATAVGGSTATTGIEPATSASSNGGARMKRKQHSIQVEG